MIKEKPYLLTNTIQNYSWGTKNEEAYIPNLLGVDPENNLPYAELWMGAHGKASSMVIDGKDSFKLDELIKEYPEEILGAELSAKFQNKLPFLFKVLSAAEPLSIQTHPDKNQAKTLHQIDPVNYPDDNHKPEIAIAIDNLEALVGFKSFGELVEVCKEYSEIVEFAELDNTNNLTDYINKGDNTKREALKKFYKSLINKALSNKNEYINLLDSINNKIIQKKDRELLKKEEILFYDLRSKFDADIGLISILFLNYITLLPGEAIFTKPGIPHAYIKGNLIECMGNSDNVIRAGLTPKFVDAENLLSILTYEFGIVEKVKQIKNNFLTVYETDAEEFSVSSINLDAGDSVDFQSNGKPSILLVLEGNIKILYGEESVQTMTASKGNSFLLPAALKNYRIVSDNKSLGYLANTK